ncbi:C-type lectin domain family 4 member F [Amia ocellicauda]|uniref:C-type lectin domain family 4 member F n=1 Tax=Amia ocellicauda TaxID=2972642 RepID=UPI0034644FF7
MELEEMPHKPAEGNSPAGSSAQTREGCKMYLYRVKMISLAVLCILQGAFVMFLKYHNPQEGGDCEMLKAKFDHLSSLMNTTEDRYSELRDENRNLSETLAALKQYQEVLEGKYTGLVGTHAALEGSLNALKEENRQLSDARTDLQRQLSDLRTRDCKPCPEGWETSDGKCYFFSTDEKNWDESRDDCVRRGGHLAIIRTRQEQTFIKTQINGFMNVGKNKYWIGLTDAAAEGVWRWVDNTPLGKFRIWAQNEPDDWRGENTSGEDCVTIEHEQWYDASCEHLLKRVCETRAVGNPSS